MNIMVIKKVENINIPHDFNPKEYLEKLLLYIMLIYLKTKEYKHKNLPEDLKHNSENDKILRVLVNSSLGNNIIFLYI